MCSNIYATNNFCKKYLYMHYILYILFCEINFFIISIVSSGYNLIANKTISPPIYIIKKPVNYGDELTKCFFRCNLDDSCVAIEVDRVEIMCYFYAVSVSSYQHNSLTSDVYTRMG